jgi:outer membrane protein TolC
MSNRRIQAFLIAFLAAAATAVYSIPLWARPSWQSPAKSQAAEAVGEEPVLPGAPASEEQKEEVRKAFQGAGGEPQQGAEKGEGEAFSLGLAEGGDPSAGVLQLSLDDCIERALANNQKIRAAGYGVSAAQGQLIEAKAIGWPVLEYQYRVAPVPTDVNNAFSDFFNGNTTLFNSIKLAIGVPLVTFGQLGSAVKMARGGVEAARIEQGKTKANVVYQVKQLYYGVQFAKEMIKLLHDAVDRLGDKIAGEEAWSGDDGGSGPGKAAKKNRGEPGMDPYDLLQLKGFKLDMERRLDEAKQNLDMAYEGLRIQLNLEPGADVELDDDNLRPVLATLNQEDAFVDAAMTLQPEVKLVDIGVETKRQQYRLEKFKLLPKLGFGFYMEFGRSLGPITGLKLTDDFNNPFNYSRAGIGLQLSGTLDFHGAAGRIKKARAEYYKATFERLIARRGLHLDIQKAYRGAKIAQENLRRAKKAEALARQAMFITKVNVDMGIGDAQRYGDALKYFLLARGIYFKSIYDYNLALADLEQRIGQAKYQDVVPTPSGEDYDAFNGDDDDEGYITLQEDTGNATAQKPKKPQTSKEPAPLP